MLTLHFIFLFLGCSINRIVTYCNNGPCRISSVSIVTAMPDLEKNLDNINRNIINGSTIIPV